MEKSDKKPERSDSEGSQADSTSDEQAAPAFIPDQCLFCAETTGTLDNNIAHMASAHSFIDPYQDCLTADLETHVWYLHFVIYRYGECIICALRRSTIEGIQQPMAAEGHCQFGVSADFEDFYGFHSTGFDTSGIARPDEGSLRLPSGEVLADRTQATGPRPTNATRHSTAQPASTSSLPSVAPISSVDATTGDDRDAALLASQLSRLGLRDQQSLAHRPGHEVRSLLVTRKKQLDRSRREKTRAEIKLERSGNQTLMKHYIPDVPKRLRGSWR